LLIIGYYTVKIKEAELKTKLKILSASVILSMAMAINTFGATQNVIFNLTDWRLS
jgi:hypothetical protein